jgi:hypothetical protein
VLITSGYAVAEARRNLADPDQRSRLAALLRPVRVVHEAPDRPLPPDVDLPGKDRPILLAAVQAGATHLLTGDVRHFGPFFGREVLEVMILPPGRYLRQHAG